MLNITNPGLLVQHKKKKIENNKLPYLSKASLASSVWRSVGEGSLQPRAASRSGNILNLLNSYQQVMHNYLTAQGSLQVREHPQPPEQLPAAFNFETATWIRISIIIKLSR